jgi:uncharacterized membrane protein
MIDRIVFGLTFVSAFGSGLIGGVFFAFSTFIMQALGRLPAAHGIAAMQSINVVVLNRWFLTAFMGTAVTCAALAVITLAWRPSGSILLLAGSALYVIGTFLVTIAFNVPRNNALAAVAPDSMEAAALWSRYLKEWTAWNHVRTLAALVAMAVLVLGLLAQARAVAAPS